MARAKSGSVDTVYSALFDEILAGSMEAGTRLKEEELAKRFGVSRTPIREVLRMLEADGLVRLESGRGAVVCPFTADDLEELYDIRSVLECLALDRAAGAIPLRELGEIETLMAKAERKRDWRMLADADARLHGLVLDYARRPRLVAVLQRNLRLMHRFRALGFQNKAVRSRSGREHTEFIGALFRRDRAKAREILSAHIRSSKEYALTCMHAKARKSVVE